MQDYSFAKIMTESSHEHYLLLKQ